MGRAAKRKTGRKEAPLLKLDLGSGATPREGFDGVDILDLGQKHRVDLREPWPWADNSVEEAHTSHFIEHLTATERVHFFNELHRVLVPNGKCLIVVPHWASNRAYGDPTHQWPPFSEMALLYLKREWRMANAVHTDVSNWSDGYSCDFEPSWGYNMRPDLLVRNQEYQMFALNNYKEAAQDTVATITALKGGNA